MLIERKYQMTSNRLSTGLSLVLSLIILLSGQPAWADSVILKNGSNLECVILLQIREYTITLSPGGLSLLPAPTISQARAKELSKGFRQSMQEAFGPAWENHAKWEKTRVSIRERKKARDAKQLVRRPDVLLKTIFGKTKIPGDLNLEKLLEVCRILLNLSSPAVVAPGRRIDTDEDTFRKTAITLEELKIKPVKYIEFFYDRLPLSPLLVRMDGASRKNLLNHLRSATLSVYAFLPGEETNKLLKGIINDKRAKNSHKELALDTLINIDFEEATAVLLKTLTSKDVRLRGIAAAKITGMHEGKPDPKLSSPIMELLNNPSTPIEVKPEIVQLLFSFNDLKIVKRLTELVYFLDDATITEIIRSLGRFADEETREMSVPLLSRFLETSMIAEQQKWAAVALGRLGDWKALPALIEALKEKNKDVSDAAWRALRNITGKRFEKIHAIWNEWYKAEGKRGKPKKAGRTAAGRQTHPSGYNRTPYRPPPSIRPTLLTRKGRSNASGAREQQPGATSSPVSRKRNIIMISLLGIAFLSVVFLIIFFRKGTPGKQKKA